MAKLTLSDLTNLQNEQTAVSTINANNQAIEDAFELNLTRTGTNPNFMAADLDMDSNRILNLPDALTEQEPVTKGQMDDAIDALEAGGVITASFVTLSNDPTLTTERVLTAGENISITDAGAGSTVTVAVSGADLNALEAVSTDGILTRTADATYATRTVTGTANEISVANGDGISGNPTISIPSSVTFTGKSITGGTFTNPVINNPAITVLDNGLTLQDQGDATKQLQFEVSGISTGTTRSLAVPNANTTIVGTDATQTLTNKTLALGSNTVTGTTAQFNTALTDGDFATLAGTETLTNKTINLTNNTLSGTLAQFNTAVSDTDVAGIAATQTLTNKTMSGASNTFSNIALSSHATQAAYTFVGNNTGSAAAPTAVDIAALTTKGSPAAGDYLILSDQAASGAWKKATVSSVAAGAAVSTLNGQTGAVVLGLVPQGRLTLTTGTPVMSTAVNNATTVYYTPYQGNMIPIYDGTNFVPTIFTELSQTTTDATKSPAAVANNSIYDIFVWNDAGTIRATRGPAWTSDTARSAGTALTLVGGIYLNNAAITNGPAASRGTYVGSIRSDASAQIDYRLGGQAALGSDADLKVWNAYNRVAVCGHVGDTTDSWTYGSSVWRASNNSTTMRVSILVGLQEDGISVSNLVMANNPSGDAGATAFGYDSATVVDTTSGRAQIGDGNATSGRVTITSSKIPAIGYHFWQPLEKAVNNAVAVTFIGDGGVDYQQSGLNYIWRA